MAHQRMLVALALLLALSISSPPPAVAGVFHLPNLTYAYNATEPVVDSQTMTFHHDTHHATYIRNLNAAVAPYNASVVFGKPLTNMPLTQMISRVGGLTLQIIYKINATVETTIRNNAGGHEKKTTNHAQWWRILKPYNASAGISDGLSDDLRAAIDNAFGNFTNMVANLTALGASRFGSGWSWLVVLDAKGTLGSMSTPNQDNPLMSPLTRSPPTNAAAGILGIDVWEHAYYLKYGPGRATYLANIWKVINWTQVSLNYDAGKQIMAGNIAAGSVIVGNVSEIPY